MLSMLWWFPLAMAAAAVIPLWRGTRRLLAEAGDLRLSIDELAGLRPAVAQVQAEIVAVAAAAGRPLHDLGPR
jgi:hypothetical protein